MSATNQWPQGDTYTLLALTLQSSDGTPINLSSVTASAITVSLRPQTPISQSVACTGTAAIISASTGSITFQFSTADVATPGIYWLEVKVAFSPQPWYALPIAFQITRSS